MSAKYNFDRGPGLDYVAHDEDGNEVGRIDLEEQEIPTGFGTHSTFTVVNMRVDKAHRREGIATELVRLALADHPDVLFPDLDPAVSKDMGGDYRYMLEPDGQNLVKSLLKKKISNRANLMSSAGDVASDDSADDDDPWGDGFGYPEDEEDSETAPPASSTMPFAGQHSGGGASGRASDSDDPCSDDELDL